MISKLTCFLTLTLFFIIVPELYSQNLQSEKLKLKETSALHNDSNKTALTTKSPVLAGAMSFIVPGFALGQLYNGEISKFGTHLGITGGCVLVGLLGVANFSFNVSGGPSKGTAVGPVLILIAAGAYTVNWIWSVVDAVISANKINKQARLKKYRTELLDKLKWGFGMDKSKQLNFKISIGL